MPGPCGELPLQSVSWALPATTSAYFDAHCVALAFVRTASSATGGAVAPPLPAAACDCLAVALLGESGALLVPLRALFAEFAAGAAPHDASKALGCAAARPSSSRPAAALRLRPPPAKRLLRLRNPLQ